MEKKRILGIDYGQVRTGVAVSDPTGLMAGGVGTIRTRRMEVLVEQIAAYADSYDVARIVVGNPINMNGTRGEKSENAAYLAERIREATGREVVLFDERCTTLLAHQILNETDTRGAKRKNVVDTLSAEIILQNYLDREKNRGQSSL